jgi:MFS transporter, CP family, cyanate transporter
VLRSRPESAGSTAPRIERAKIRQRLILFVLLWLSGACLRLTVLAIPPVVPLLHADLHLSETGIGWLSSLPPMLFAIAAVPGALIIARFGMVPALLVALLLTVAGSALRGAVANIVFLYTSTIAMGAGVAIGQTVMPPLVRSWFPQRIGLATTIYTNGLLIGEILPVGLTIPLILPLVHDSWRLDLVFWSLPVLATALFVSACAPSADTAKVTDTPIKRRWWPDWRNGIIWRLGLILGSVNSIYFVSNAFLPDYVIARGRPDLVSSALTALNVGQLPATFLLLGFADRLLRRPSAYWVTGLATFLCLVAMMSMDGWWIVFWAGMEGFTNAVTLILALALPSILSAADDVHRTAAGMFTISYSCAMAFSVLGGWLWDLTHLPIAGFAPVAVCALVIVALSSTVRHAVIQPATAR